MKILVNDFRNNCFVQQQGKKRKQIPQKPICSQNDKKISGVSKSRYKYFSCDLAILQKNI